MKASVFSRRPLLRVFAVPILLGVLSAVGLLAALLGDGIWDGLSWLTLAVPCAVIVWYWFFAGRDRKARLGGEKKFGGGKK